MRTQKGICADGKGQEISIHIYLWVYICMQTIMHFTTFVPKTPIYFGDTLWIFMRFVPNAFWIVFVFMARDSHTQISLSILKIFS